jgi:hypothetical protein
MMLKIAYVLASGHSGSTIFGRVLGELDGWFHAGELSLIWRQGLGQGRLCGCGRSMHECEIWSRVANSVFGQKRIGLADVTQWQQEVLRAKNVRRLLEVNAVPSGWDALDRYVEVMSHMYHAIADITGQGVIVDSSKREDGAALLRLLPGIESRVIHLVRDPRGVVYSWHRHERSTSRSWVGGHRPFPGVSARGWTARNRRARWVCRSIEADNYKLVRYEDFVARPRHTVEGVARFVGELPTGLPFVDDRTVRLGVNHTAGGNSNRFRTGQIALEEDLAWMSRLPRSSRFLATCLTLPLLRRYGYPIFPARSKTSATRSGG